jgi:hypothetical protein
VKRKQLRQLVMLIVLDFTHELIDDGQNEAARFLLVELALSEIRRHVLVRLEPKDDSSF